eukprot:365255-Chlamydomonas_euryale.AAC.27
MASASTPATAAHRAQSRVAAGGSQRGWGGLGVRLAARVPKLQQLNPAATECQNVAASDTIRVQKGANVRSCTSHTTWVSTGGALPGSRAQEL